MNVLSLFSGIGGLELGLERAGMTVVGQVEIDDYCRRVLAKHWPNVPRHDDVRTAAEWWLSIERPAVDVVCGGFPCQDISAAGKRAGIVDGERSGLWAYMAGAIRRIQPRYVLVENVPRVLVRGGDGVIPAEVVAADLAALGYDLRWDCIPAAAVGAPHRRDRWFGIAYAQRGDLRLESVPESGRGGPTVARSDGSTQPLAHPAYGTESEESQGRRLGRQPDCSGACAGGGTVDGHPAARTGLAGRGAGLLAPAVADAGGERCDRHAHIQGARRSSAFWREAFDHAGDGRSTRLGTAGDQWATEPDVGRVAHGVPARVDRLRALGNAVVPQVAEYVGRLIVGHASAAA